MPGLKSLALLLSAVAFAGVIHANEARAVSDDVRNACHTDYVTYCKHHRIGSNSLRACMRENSKRLSPSCRLALMTSGEASPEDVRRYKRDMAKGGH
ncbi:MAG: hypothetical protein AB7S74_00940 [Hyphomicrobium sp.]